MANKYFVLNNGKLVLERWVGNISHAELVQHVEEQVNDARIASGAVLLADGREATFDETNAENLRDLQDLRTRPGNKANIMKIAFLTASKNWPLSKVFEVLAEEIGITIISFVELQTACAWLDIDEEATRQALRSITFDEDV